MELDRKDIHFHYTLTPDWLDSIAAKMGAKVINNKILQMSRPLADGEGMFLEVLPGLSVFLIDMYFREAVAIKRVPTEDLYVVYYDLGEEITTHLLGSTPHRAGYTSKLGMAFMDSLIPTSLLPPLGARSYSLRLLISKELLLELTGKIYTSSVSQKLFDSSQNTLYFYSHIDSKSKILLKQLMGRSLYDPSFEYHLKHAALYLLVYLVERASRFEPIINKLSEIEIESVNSTAHYLLENLLSDFPGIETLSSMARMSSAKYKLLFKKILKDSPKQFFLNEKLLLAKEILESGNFKSVSQVAYQLGYSKPTYFAEVFKRKFGINPKSILSKKTS